MKHMNMRSAMDMVANNNYYKSKDSDILKKIDCDNINSNLNGGERLVPIDPTTLNGIGSKLAQGGEGEVSTNAFGNGETTTMATLTLTE